MANTNGQKLALGSQTTTPGLATGRSQISPGKRTLALGVAAIGDIIKNLAAVSRGKPDPQSGGVEAISGLLESRDEKLRQEKLDNVRLKVLAQSMDASKLKMFRDILDEARKFGETGAKATDAQLKPLLDFAESAGVPITIDMLRGAAADPASAQSIINNMPLLAIGPNTGSIVAIANGIIKKNGFPAAKKYLQQVANTRAMALLVPQIPGLVSDIKTALGKPQITIQDIASRIRGQKDPVEAPGINNSLANFVLGIGIDPKLHEQFVEALGPDVERPGFKRELGEKLEVQKALQPGKIELETEAGKAGALEEEKIRLGRKISPEVRNILSLPPSIVTQADAENANIAIPEPNSPEMRELKAGKSFAQQAIRTSDIIQDLVRVKPEALGFSGAVASSVNSLVAQTQNFARIAGIPVNASLNPKDYQDTFKDIGITNARLQSQIIGLAFAAAAASGQTGRGISDRDIELFLRKIGGSTQDPVALMAVLEDFKEDVDFRFRSQVSAVLGREPPPLLKRDQIDPKSLTSDRILSMTANELIQVNVKDLDAKQLKSLDEALKKLGL